MNLARITRRLLAGPDAVDAVEAGCSCGESEEHVFNIYYVFTCILLVVVSGLCSGLTLGASKVSRFGCDASRLNNCVSSVRCRTALARCGGEYMARRLVALGGCCTLPLHSVSGVAG